MRLLIFYQGTDEDESNDFLELVRTESAKLTEELDIVNTLWMKDLSNIQYYSPEEFIENRILEERAESLSKRGLQIIPQELAGKVIDIKVDKENLFSGKLDLKPEEKQALDSFVDQDLSELPDDWQSNFPFEQEEPKKEEAGGQPPEPQSQSLLSQKKLTKELALNEGEIQQLNRLVEKNRQLSPEDEFLNLMMEILALEKNSDQFKANLDVLYDFYQENLKAGRFRIPILLSQKIKNLKTLISSEENRKVPLLDEFLSRTSNLRAFEEIRKLVE